MLLKGARVIKSSFGGKSMRKIIVVGVILLFFGASVPVLASHKSLPMYEGTPPLPPVLWTENFLDFFIQVPENPDEDQMYYMVDWGDGTSSGWIGPYNPGQTISVSHVWAADGGYQMTVQAQNQGGVSDPAFYLLSLSPEFKLFCVTLGYVSLTYFITLHAEERAYYLFDWGDGNTSGWLGPYNDTVLTRYTWFFPGEYLLRWKAKDVYGSETPWSSVSIKIVPLQPQPVLSIGAITGGFGVKAQIRNIGNANATNVTVTITFYGAWMLLPLLEQYHTTFDLRAGASENISVMVFGLGKTNIKIDASCAESSSATKTATGTVFLFFMVGVN